ncbi:MAG: adenylate kinase, partial [Bacteroidia bacterium]
ADSGRADDRDENVIRRRIFNYNNQTAPLKKYYSEQKKFHSVYGMGSIDDIFELLVATIDNKTQAKKPYHDGNVTVADISVEDEPAKHLKDVFETIKDKAKPVVNTIKELFKKKTVAKPVKKTVSAKKKTATKPAAKKAKVVKKSPAKKKAVAKKIVKKKATPKKKVAVKKAKPVTKKSTKKVAKKAPAKKL